MKMPPTKLSTLSLHDALPILTFKYHRLFWTVEAFWKNTYARTVRALAANRPRHQGEPRRGTLQKYKLTRSEEHTSELQSPCNLVCRLLLEKEKRRKTRRNT